MKAIGPLSTGEVLLQSAVQKDIGEGDPSQWTLEPTITVGVAILVGLYLFGVGPLRRRYGWAATVEPRQIALFLLGSLVLLLTLVSPLDVLSEDYLFSAHMVQHMLLISIVPPLWLLGTPGWLLRPLLKPRPVARAARVLTNPFLDLLLFNCVFFLWHLPALYDLALADHRVHALQHLSFIAAAVLNWWPVLSPLPELPRLRAPQQVFYLLLNCQPEVAFGALCVFSREVLYQGYLEAPRLFGLSPIADQQLGGLIMWIPGNAVYLLVVSIVFLRWITREEQGRPGDTA